MKKLLLSLVAVIFSLAVSAQSGNFHAEGIVKDSLTGMAEPFVTLRLMKVGQERPVAVAASDENGRFKIGTTKAGTYELQVSTIGKTTLKRKVTLSSAKTLNLGTLLLTDASNALGEATVTAQKVVVKAEVDRIGYSMKDDPDAQTNTLLEMLRKVPMVQVDGEDNIQVNGSSSFKVYVNGKPNQMMSSNPSLILKNYPASAVKKVEVVTDPGAKYDAEGVAGILNIVTDAETKTSGYTLTPNINIGNRGVSGNVFAMAQIGKFTVSANYGIGRHTHGEKTSWSERETFGNDLNHLLRSEGIGDGNGTFQFGSLDASYEFDEKNLLSFSAGLNTYHGHNTDLTDYRMTAADGTQTYAYTLFSKSREKWEGYNASIDYQHTFDKEGQNLTLSYQFNTNPGGTRSTSLYSNIVDVPYELRDLYSEPDTRSTEHTAQADFTTPIGKIHTLSAGLKYIYRLNASDNFEGSRLTGTDDEFVRDEERSIDYRHRADIGAAYGEYTLKLDKFTTRAGLRYEYSHFDVSYPDGKHAGFSTKFNDLVPSLNFGYNFTPSMMLKAGYNIRIGRPSISYLSPYVSRPTAETQSYGNPNLDSEKAHNFSLGFSTFSPKFSINTTLAYMVQNNGLTAYSFLDDNNVMTTTYGNLRHSKTLALSLFVNWTIVNGTSLNINAEGNYQNYKAYRYHNNENAHNRGFGGGFFGGLRQDLPWKLKLGLHGGGRLSRVELQGTRPGFYFYGINVSRSFLDEDRLTVSVQAGNFIKPKRQFRNETITPEFRYESMNEMNFMRFSVGIRYRLGSLKAIVKKVERSIENTDVIQQQSSEQSQQGASGGGM